MEPLTMGLITGGASLLGSIFSSSTNAQNTQANIGAQEAMQSQTEAFNAQQADINRQFQSGQVQEAQQYNTGQVQQQEAFQNQMSSTAYQRASADMKAAGLNPMMMFGSGSAASTPSGAMATSPTASGSGASVGTPNMALSNRTSPLAGLGDAVGKAVGSAVQAKTFDKMTEEIANIQADSALRSAQTRVADQTERLVGSKADQAGYGVTESHAAAEVAQRYLDMPSWLKNSVEYTKYGASGVGSVADVIGSLVGTAKQARNFSPPVNKGYTEQSDTQTFEGGSSTFKQRWPN